MPKAEPKALVLEQAEILDELVSDARSERRLGPAGGVLAGFDETGAPLVDFHGNPSGAPVLARTTARLPTSAIGEEVALLFENEDPTRPIVIGIYQSEVTRAEVPSDQTIAQIDGERIVLRAEHEIVLRCGRSSITLAKDGKIVIRGTDVLSRSSGSNRIKGGSVQLN